MAYTKTNWVNDSVPAINATNLNNIEEGIYQAHKLIDNMIDIIYPIGSIYMNVNSTNPSFLFGGTWEQLKDRFLLAAGDIYTNGSTGGEATHNLIEAEMPEHEHTIRYGGSDGNGVTITTDGSLDYQVLNITTYEWSNSSVLSNVFASKSGQNQPHNNMPPYLTVHIWKRTA